MAGFVERAPASEVFARQLVQASPNNYPLCRHALTGLPLWDAPIFAAQPPRESVNGSPAPVSISNLGGGVKVERVPPLARPRHYHSVRVVFAPRLLAGHLNALWHGASGIGGFEPFLAEVRALVNQKMVDMVVQMVQEWHMDFMAREPAEWRSHMRDDEREELDRAERMRDVAAENLRVTVKRIKDRVIKRMRRAGGNE